MVRRAIFPHRCWLLLAFSFLVSQIVFFAGRQEQPLVAAPHTIGHVDHPYDADWPDVQIVLSTKCTSCHRAGTDRQDFTSYASLMAAGQRDGMPAVVPGDADQSMLWEMTCWNVQAHGDSDLPDQPDMPPNRLEWLSAGQLATIRRWINNGALQYKLPDQCDIHPLMATDFPSARQCAGCHPRQYEEWSRSMHAYAQVSPVFEAFNLTLVERTSGTIGTFCTRCHTPIGTALGENESRRNVHRARISLESVTCIACHRRKEGRYKASGSVRVEPGQLLDACIFGPFDDAMPVDGAHPSAQLPYIKSSHFCGECHDVTSPQGVRLEEAFSEWHNSPAAKDSITCHACHMGPVQGVPIHDDQRPLGRAAEVPGIDPSYFPLRRLSDHTFAGPDYSLLPDTEFPHKLDWMYEKDYRDVAKLTPHEQWSLNELRRRNRKSLREASAKRYELLRNAAKIAVNYPEYARTGDRIEIQVAVTSTFSGHSFPTGFTAARQAWVSIQVRDPMGRLVFASGDLDQNQDLRDDHSHSVLTGRIPYDRHLLNFQSKFIALSNKGTERSVVISVNRHLQPTNVVRPASGISASFGRPQSFRVSKGSLPPLATRSKSYPLRLGDCAGPYFVAVKLNFRHLPPTLLDHVGTPHLKHLLEIVVIDEHHGMIDVRMR